MLITITLATILQITLHAAKYSTIESIEKTKAHRAVYEHELTA